MFFDPVAINVANPVIDHPHFIAIFLVGLSPNGFSEAYHIFSMNNNILNVNFRILKF